MKFISLGRHCDIGHNIKLYNKDQPITNFFDWLRSDFVSVLHILNIGNIENIFNKENMIIDKKSYAHENNVSITFKNFEANRMCFISHHDIELNKYNDQTMHHHLNELIEKYKRRYYRLIDMIKSSEKLIFIHKGWNFNEAKHVNEFRNAIWRINKNAHFYLVLLVDTPGEWVVNKKDNYIKININKLINRSIKTEWHNPQFNWQEIFNIIKRNV